MEEDKNLILDFIETAELGEHSQFQFIRSIEEYKLICTMRRGLKVLVRSLKKSASRLFKQYYSDIVNNTADVNKLVAYCLCKNTLEFYKEELSIAFDMMEEYECYLLYGSPLDLVFNLYRSDENLRDYRE